MPSNIVDRMSRYEEYKAKRLAEAKNAKEEQSLAGITLEPAFQTKNCKKYAKPKDPIFKRLDDMAENKRAILERVTAELTVDCVFQPVLEAKQAYLQKHPDATPSLGHLESGERMYKDAGAWCLRGHVIFLLCLRV